MSTQDQSIEERRQKLQEQAERKQKMNDAHEWSPEPGEVLEGEYLGKRISSHEAYGETPVYYVEDFSGTVFSLLGRTVLENEMVTQDATPGDLVAVTYEGKRNSDEAVGEFYAYDVVTA